MSFYGFESAPEAVRDMYNRLLSCWSKETCAPRYRPEWSEENPTLGQCSITSFLVQDILGGEVYGILLPDGAYHCFNEVDGFRFDLTSEQFGDEKLDYDRCVPQSREEHFENADKYARYLLLKQRYLALKEAKPSVTVAPLSRKDVGAAAPLVAGFRVELNRFRRIETEPDIPSGEEELNEYFDHGFPVFGAWENGRLIGYMVCRPDGYCLWVESLYVLPSRRRRGAAGALFAKAEELAASMDEDTVYNYVHPNNEAVIAFLRSRGYTVLNLIEIRKPYKGEKLTEKVSVNNNEFDY